MSGTFLINKKIFNPDVTLDSKGRVTDMSFNSSINALHCPDMDTKNMVIKNTLDVSKVDVSNCFVLPVGIENDRVTIPGSIRFNTDNKQFEGCNDDSQWGGLGGVWSQVNSGEIRLTTDLDYNKIIDIKDVTISGTGLAPTAVSTDNSTKIATTAFVQTAVAGIVDSAPETLNTLNELAAALGDDPNYTTTITTKLGQIDASFVVVDTSFAVIDASFVSVTNDINNLDGSKHPLIDASNRLNANLIADGSVDNTEFQYLNGTTANIQLQINELDASANLQEKHINTYTNKIINVTVQPKTPTNPNIGQGSANCFYFDNVETPIIMLIPGITYIFDQSDPTNLDHPLRFYEDEHKGLIYNEGVTSTGLGTEGNPGAYTQIIVTKKTKMRLFYQCFHDILMGGKALIYNSENYEYFYSKDASFNDVYINNDLHVKNDISCNNVIVSGHSFKDLSGTVTNLVNRPVGIWSEVNTDEIRLTTSSDYGKLVDISGLKITNNVEVLGDISCNDVSCNGVLNIDTINELTSLNGVVIEQTKIHNNIITTHTISAQNYNLGSRNIVSASAQGSFTDLELKDSNGHVGLLAYGATGNVNMTGTLEVDTINEKTNLNGVVIEGVTVKNNSLTAGSNGTITASNFNVGTRNIVSASAQGSFTDLEIKDSNGHIGLLVDGANGNVKIYGTLEVDTINEITSATGVTIENVLFRDGDISCNGLLHVSGDISCNNIKIGSNSFTDLSNNITQLDVSANTYENRLNTIDISFSVVDASFASVETKMEMIDNSFSVIDASFTKIDGLMNIIDASFSVVDASYVDLSNNVSQLDISTNLLEKHINTYSNKTIKVTVNSKTSSNPTSGQGSSSCYYFDNIETPIIMLIPGITYIFDQSDTSNSSHPLLFYEDENKVTPYNTGVSTVGTAGNSGAYTQIIVTKTTKMRLYYQCQAHSLMGGKALIYNSENYESFYSKDASFNDAYVENDLHVKNDISCNNIIVSGNSFTDLSNNVSKLDVSANTYENRLDTIDASFSVVDASFSVIDSSFSSIDTKIQTIDASFSVVDASFSVIDASFSSIDTKMQTIDASFSVVDASFSSIDTKMQTIDSSFSVVDASFSVVDASYVDLSGTVTNLINQPVGIWSEVTTDEIRLTTASNYGKLVDISGMDISNNLTVEGGLTLGFKESSSYTQGTLRYTDVSRVEVYYNSKWNQLSGGGGGGGAAGLWGEVNLGEIRLSSDLNYNKKVDISGLDIGNNLDVNNNVTVGGNIHLTGGLFKDGYMYSLDAKQTQITETLVGICQGQSIVGNKATYSFTDVTKQTPTSGNYFSDWTDISGSKISYTPPTDTECVKYSFKFVYGKTLFDDNLMTKVRFLIDGTDISNVEIQLNKEQQNNYYTFETVIRIDNSVSSDDINNSIFKTWGSSKELKLQIKEFNQPVGSYSWLHNMYSWNNGAPTNALIKPTLDIQSIGTLIYQIDVADISKWSYIGETDKIRLTTASDYGKVLDISSADISNNLIVKGTVSVGYGGTTDISGTLRYTDLSKVEVFHDGIWNQIAGGVWSDESKNGIIRLTEDEDYDKNLDISGMDISNNLTVKGKFNLSGDLYKNGTLVSLNSEIIQVIENIAGLSDGQSILGNQGTYTLPDVTKQTPASGYYFSDWTDVSGSKIEYKPPPGAKYIKYVYKFAYGKTLYDEQMMTNIRFLIGNTVITSTMKQLTKEKQNNYYTFETIIRIDSTLSSDDLQNLTVKDWTANRTLKIQIKEFNQVVGSQSWLHNIYSWENGAPVNKVSKPTMDVMVVGNLIQKIDVSEITKLISISGETIQMVENIAGLAEGQTLDGFQSNYTLENVTAKQTPSSGTYFSTWHDILGSKLSYKPPENSPIVKYSFKFAYGKKLFDDNLMTNIRFLLGGTVITNTEIQLNKDNQNNQYTFDCIIRIDDTLSSDDVANSKLKTWSANKEMKLQIKEFNNDVGNESWLHNIYSWENGAPVNKVIKPTLDIQAMGYLTRIITDISSGIWGEVNTNEIRMMNSTNYDKKLDVSGIDVSNNLVVDGIFSLNGRFNTHLLPTTNSAYDLGSAEYKIRHLFLSDNSLWIGDEHKIDVSGGKLKFKKRNKNKVPQSLLNIEGKDESTILNEIFGPGHGKTTQNVALHQWYEYAARPEINISNELLFSSTGLGDGVDDFFSDIQSSDSLLIQDVDQTILGTKTFTNLIISGEGTASTQASGDNSTKIATTAFVKSEIDNLIGGAPDALNTLNELATVLGNDANFSGTIINRLTQVDTSCNDLSGVVTANIASIAANESNISTLDNDKAPKVSPTFSGNVGIGTTSTRKLAVSGTSRFNNIEIMPTGEYSDWSYAPGGSNFTHTDGEHYGQIWSIDNVSGASYPLNEQGHLVIQPRISTGRNVFFRTGGASVDHENIRMTIKHDGNVGIGTTSPGSKLEVVGDISCSRIYSNTESVATSFYASGLQIPNTSSNYNMILSGNPPSDSTNGAVHFINSATRTGDGGTLTYTIRNDSGRLRLGNASYDTLIEGNVGIGTTSPIAPLSVCRIHDFNTTRDMGVHMGVYNSGGAHFPNIQFVSNHQDGSWIDFVHTTTGNSDFDGRIRYSHTNGFKFFTNTTQQMTIDTNGNVGIGASSPKFPLHVESGDNTYKFGSPGTETYTYFSYNHVGIPSGTHSTDAEWDYDTSIYAKYGIVTNTYIVSHRGAIVSSDERIKCEIENVPDDLALNQVLALETKYYHYKDPKRRETEKTIGFIAQEVESIIPGTVVKRQQFIPNILKTGDAIWTPKKTDTSGNTIMWNLQVANLQDISANTEVKFYFYNGDISNNTDIIEYEKDLTAIDASNNFEIDTKYDHVFVFGVKVNDFRTIKKEKIFALHHSAIQQIHKNAETEKAKLAEAESEITTLKSTVETQQTTIDNQQTMINTLQSTLAALEARITALENP